MNRTLPNDAKSTTNGVVYLDCSFLTNNTSNPTSSTYRGDTSFWSVTRTGVGVFKFVITDPNRYVIAKTPDLEDLNSSDDGAYATAGAIQNEGTAGAYFNIYTRAAAGTKTDYTNRRVSVLLVIKNSQVGT